MIRLQKLAMPATGRKTFGPSFFCTKIHGEKDIEETNQALYYIPWSDNYSDSEKQLNISDLSYAVGKLHDLGYYTLIDGYKDIFYNSMTRIWKWNKVYWPCSIIWIWRKSSFPCIQIYLPYWAENPFAGFLLFLWSFYRKSIIIFKSAQLQCFKKKPKKALN